MWYPCAISTATATWNSFPRGTGASETKARGFTMAAGLGTSLELCAAAAELALGTKSPAAGIQNTAQETAIPLIRIVSLNLNGRAQFFGQNAAHHLVQRLAGFFLHEGLRGIRPAQFEAGGQRGNPNLPHGRVGANEETRFVLIFKFDFELSAAAFHFEIVRVAEFEQAIAQGFECGVALFCKFVFTQHGKGRLPHLRESEQESAAPCAEIRLTSGKVSRHRHLPLGKAQSSRAP